MVAPSVGRQTQVHAYRSPVVVRFLPPLLRKIRGKLLVIWDGSPIHRGQLIKDFPRHGAAVRLHLEQMRDYAPELNPDEGIWKYLKRVELGHVCCPDLRHKRAVIQARIRLADCHV
jgi:transposase